MLNDLLILTKIKDGDVKAFEQVFRQYYMPLCLYAASITGRMDIAEEIVQELFLVFWRERERLQLFHTIKSYLYGAVRNQSLQYWEHPIYGYGYGYGWKFFTECCFESGIGSFLNWI